MTWHELRCFSGLNDFELQLFDFMRKYCADWVSTAERSDPPFQTHCTHKLSSFTAYYYCLSVNIWYAASLLVDREVRHRSAFLPNRVELFRSYGTVIMLSLTSNSARLVE
jgi:hypothetical protein